MTTVVERLSSYDEAALEQVIAIYRDAIEPSEQKPSDQVRKLASHPAYEVLVARRDGAVAGFAMQMFPSTGDFWLLEYVAVDRSRRSSGLGAELFRAVLEAGERRLPGAPALLEVDQPGTQVSAGNDVARRLRFYARQGCRTVDGLTYVLPLETAGTPPPMQLLVHGLAGIDVLPAETVRRWLTTLYVEVYGCDATDRRVKEMIGAAGDQIALRPMLE